MKRKGLWISAISFSIIVLSFTLLSQLSNGKGSASSGQFASRPYPLTKTIVQPATPAKEQTMKMPGESSSVSNPGAYIYQTDSAHGDFKVDSYREKNPGSIPNAGSDADPWPAVGDVVNKIDANVAPYYVTDGFQLEDGTTKRVGVMSEIRVTEVLPDSKFDNQGQTIRTEFLGNTNQIEFTTRVGGVDGFPHAPILGGSMGDGRNEFGRRGPFGAYPKVSVGYRTGLLLKWEAQYVEKKKIDIEGKTQMKPNTTQNLKSFVATAVPEEDGSGGVKHEYKSKGTETTTSNYTTWEQVTGQGIITIDDKGLVTALKKGTAQVRVSWEYGYYHLTTLMTIEVTDKPEIPEIPPGGGKCNPPSKVNSMKNPAAAMLPSATGVVKADNRDSEKFDVAQGIPSSEFLYANVLAKMFLANYDFGQYDGDCNYVVNVTKTYNLSWEMYEQVGSNPCTPQPNGSCTGGGPVYDWVPYSDSETVTKPYNVTREYSYWALDEYDTYRIKQASATNYALPGGSIQIDPQGYNPPTSQSSKLKSWQEHVVEPEVKDKTLPSQSLTARGSRPTIPNENWQSVAEGQVKQVKVRNDSLVWDSSKLMDNVLVETSTPAPRHVPTATQIGRNVLYKPNQKIDGKKLNGKDYPTTGNITYEVLDSVGSSSSQVFPIQGYNTVTIHTPVVNYSQIPESNRPYDQSVEPDLSRIPLVLGRDFILNFPNSGQHVNYPGYGNKDYTKYVDQKRIQFPFDVYAEGQFYSAGSWIPLSVTQTTTRFRLPEWVNEGNYTVRTESWAINHPNTANSQHSANTNLANYGAYETFDVEVIGRVYGFRIHDVGDLRFETVFRTKKGSKEWTGFQYYSGGKDKDGIPTENYNKATRLLPVRPGSHPTQAATTPHNGYPFNFYFNTIGNVWNADEGVKIEPEFYFVPKKGGKLPVAVDLYYNTTKNKLIKVGSSVDQKTYSRVMQLGDPLRNVDQSFINHAATFEYNNFWTDAAKNRTSLSKFLTQAKTRKVEIAKGYKDMIFDYRTRTLVGQVDSSIFVPEDTQRRAVQRWFGEYHLPIAPYILPKGTDLEKLVRTKYGGKIDGKEREFLKDGYIVVNFKITTYRNGQPNTEILAYDARANGAANMWGIEGQITSSTSYLGANFDYRYGDVIMFESDFSVRDDFSSSGR